jgi:hypothetical protein
VPAPDHLASASVRPRSLTGPPWPSARIEATTGWSIRKFVRTVRRYRTIETQAGDRTIVAADPLPDDLRDALAAITHAQRLAH